MENKNRKDYATEKWEEEIREAVAKKKSTQPGAKLSKADQALVTAQMGKEADTRKRISTVRASLHRGTELIRSLVASNSEAVSKHLRTMAESLLNSVFGPGSFLVDERVFTVFLVSPSATLGSGARLTGSHLRDWHMTDSANTGA